MSESTWPSRYRTTLALLVGLILVAGCSSIPAATPAPTSSPATATPPTLSRDLAFCGFDPIRGVADVYMTSSTQAAPTNLTRGAKQIADSAERPDTAACWFSTYNRRNYEALGLDWAPNGDRLVYIAGAAGGPDGAQMRFVAIDGSGQDVSLPVPAPVRLNQPRAPAWSPDGDSIAYIAFDRARSSPNVYSLGPQDFAIIKPLTRIEHPRYSPYFRTPIVWSPDGDRLAVSTGGGFFLLQEGMLPITVTEETFADLTLPILTTFIDSTGLSPENPSVSWSMDGAEILFVNFSQSCKCTAAMVYDRLTSTLRTLRPRARDARMSPDGKWIAVSEFDDTSVSLVILNPAGVVVRTLGRWPTPNGGFPARVQGLEWSPDSREIAFASDADGRWRVYAVDVTGGPIVSMSPSGMEAALPKWRP